MLSNLHPVFRVWENSFRLATISRRGAIVGRHCCHDGAQHCLWLGAYRTEVRCCSWSASREWCLQRDCIRSIFVRSSSLPACLPAHTVSIQITWLKHWPIRIGLVIFPPSHAKPAIKSSAPLFPLLSAFRSRNCARRFREKHNLEAFYADRCACLYNVIEHTSCFYLSSLRYTKEIVSQH